jgi:Fe2+ or Zn2+ uptake regulation protein
MTKKQSLQNHNSSSIEYILNMLKNSGFRQTSQRVSLITVLDQSKTSLSIKDIFTKLKKQKIKIDEASVYRIIETLKDLDIVHIHSNGKIKLCSHLACEQKFHLSYECEKCGKVQEPHLVPDQETEIAKILKLDLNTIRHLQVGYLCSICAN